LDCLLGAGCSFSSLNVGIFDCQYAMAAEEVDISVNTYSQSAKHQGLNIAFASHMEVLSLYGTGNSLSRQMYFPTLDAIPVPT
jgi:hypothetical protein